MNSSLRIILSLSLSLAGATAFLACGGDEGDDDTDTQENENPAMPGPGGGNLKIVFDPMYSAFEPTHTYRVPVVVDGLPPNTTWSADPADAVMIEPGEGTAMLTMLKAGNVTITAKSGNDVGTAKLYIREASPDEYAVGEMRYNQPNPAIVTSDAGMFGLNINPNASCTNCHGASSALEVEHTPQQIAGYSDEELIKVFTMAQKPEGAPMRSMFPAQFWRTFHKWNIPEEQQLGIITYLRALEPKPTNTSADFGDLIDLIPEGGLRIPRGRGRSDSGTGTTTPRNDAGADAGAGSAMTATGIDGGT